MSTALSPLSASVTRILSLSGFPKELKTKDIQAAFSEWENIMGGFRIKWLDDTSLLIVFNDAGTGKLDLSYSHGSKIYRFTIFQRNVRTCRRSQIPLLQSSNMTLRRLSNHMMDLMRSKLSRMLIRDTITVPRVATMHEPLFLRLMDMVTLD